MKDLSAAAESFERALQLNPGSAQVQQRYSLFANSLGRHEAAIQAAQRSVALDPVAPGAYRNLAMVLLFAHRYADAEGAARRALELQPDRAGGHYGLGQSLLYQGRFEEALAAFSAEPLRWGQLTGTALAHARSGQTEAARRALGTLQLEFGNNVSYQCAQIEAQLGDRDAAMKWLEFARATRDPGITDAYVDPALDPLRDDPRFQRMLADLGFDVQKQPVAASR
jgi:tetratricopeptide (TPR) repeat protein